MTDPWCCYFNGDMDPINKNPSHVSIFLPAPWIRHGVDHITSNHISIASICQHHGSVMGTIMILHHMRVSINGGTASHHPLELDFPL